MTSWASRATEDVAKARVAADRRFRDSLSTERRQCPKCGDRHLLSQQEIYDWIADLPAPALRIPSAPRGECRKIEFPEGVTVIDTMVFNGRLIAATDGGVFEVIDGVAVLLKPEMPA